MSGTRLTQFNSIAAIKGRSELGARTSARIFVPSSYWASRVREPDGET